MPPDTRDAVVDFVNRWSGKTGIAVRRFIPWLALSASKNITAGPGGMEK